MEERKGERGKMGRKEEQNPKRFKRMKQCLKEGMKGREEARCKDAFGRCSGPKNIKGESKTGPMWLGAYPSD